MTDQITGVKFLKEEVRKAKLCLKVTTNLQSECVTHLWMHEAEYAFLQIQSFEQEEAIETKASILNKSDWFGKTEPADPYQQICMGTNCVEKQVGIRDFKIYQSSVSVDTLSNEIQRISSYFDSLGVSSYASITEYRMFFVEGESSALESQLL